MRYLFWQCALLLTVHHDKHIMAFSANLVCVCFWEKSFWKSFLLMFCKPALFMLLTVRVKEVIFGTIRVSTLDFESNWQWQQRSWRTGPWFTQSLVCGLDYTQQKVMVDYQKKLPDKQFVPYGQTIGIWGFLKHNMHACWMHVSINIFAYWCGKLNIMIMVIKYFWSFFWCIFRSIIMSRTKFSRLPTLEHRKTNKKVLSIVCRE